MLDVNFIVNSLKLLVKGEEEGEKTQRHDPLTESACNVNLPTRIYMKRYGELRDEKGGSVGVFSTKKIL